VALAEELALDESKQNELAIIAAEMVSNLHRHADDGAVHLRSVRHEGDAGVQIVGIDSGPGMLDVAVSTRDGHTTAGSLGIGLGAIDRLATVTDTYSQPGTGTVLAATVWSAQAPPPSGVAAITRPIAGEELCGDGYATRLRAGRLQVMLCDGLGHGPLANVTTMALVAAFREAPDAGPARVLEYLHGVANQTRGAVASVIEVDAGATNLSCASLGNIAGWIVSGRGRRGLTAQPGYLGDRTRRTIREYDYPLDESSVIVAHTDGLTDRWDLGVHPGLLTRDALVIACMMMRDAGVRRDDAGVLVIQPSDRP
jgi:anti-sigma regulatory factor (Ser/Thr protein kinase)